MLNMNRTQFGPKGPLELDSEKLIKEASHGECRNVYRILRDGKVHPDVSDARGHTALIAATVSYSISMIKSKNLKCSLAFFLQHVLCSFYILVFNLINLCKNKQYIYMHDFLLHYVYFGTEHSFFEHSCHINSD